ncbi:MAG: 3-dehydroquinate synthase [Chloroflexi bacterium]|nr:3-dehydroquinate synthase [Chloroflexota bacterium]
MTCEPIFLYGPPGVGKSAIGGRLAQKLNVEFVDLDEYIQQVEQRSIPAIFLENGEPGFRAIEMRALEDVIAQTGGVVALGGGALLDPRSRGLAEGQGRIVVLQAEPQTLHARLESVVRERPLLGTPASLQALLVARREHYSSFPVQIDTTNLNIEQSAWEIQKHIGRFQVSGLARSYPVMIQPGLLTDVHSKAWDGLVPAAPVVVVTDSNITSLHLQKVISILQRQGAQPVSIVVPAGETSKNAAELSRLWDEFGLAGLERTSTVVALGGGVVGDLAGFAAATYLRGISWINIPTSLLAMVDAGIGGKTGIDLPLGKNLAGAFHAPLAVLLDPALLETLPPKEETNGLAELLKNAVVGDPDLFELCLQGRPALAQDWSKAISMAAAAKIALVELDPFERSMRAALNFGHTIGHALEHISRYAIPHGAAVTVGMAVEAKMGSLAGHTPADTLALILRAIRSLDLPIASVQGFSVQEILAAMQSDKKRAGGQTRLSLPLEIGRVQTGIVIDPVEQLLRQALKDLAL